MSKAEPTTWETASAGVAAVDRALLVLGAFKNSNGILSLAEIARQTNLHKSTILRLAASLEKADLLIRQSDGAWRLGNLVAVLGGIYASSYSPRELIVPVLRELVAATGESASFHTRHGNMRECRYRVDSPNPLREHAYEGQLLPLDQGAGGRILLAFDGAEGEVYERARRDMVLMLIGDRLSEIAGLAVPIFTKGDELLGSIAVSIPLTRFNEEVAAKIEFAIRQAGANLTSALGGNGTRILQR